MRALAGPEEQPPKGAKLIDLKSLITEHPKRVIVVFPECTTTNGKGILPFSPSLLSAPPQTKIFPVNLRYTPGDITTPIAGAYIRFFWNLLSQPTHCIRVRIAEVVYNLSNSADNTKDDKYLSNYLDESSMTSSSKTLVSSNGQYNEVTNEEKKVLDKVGEALARLGRSKRVGLTLKDKASFLNARGKKKV